MPRRQALYKPSLTQITELQADPHLSQILVGHLWIEAMMVKALVLGGTSSSTAWKMTWPEKVRECVDRKVIPAHQAKAYEDLNKIRNDFAHTLGQTLDLAELRAFLQLLVDLEFDDNDGMLVDGFENPEETGYDTETSLQAAFTMLAVEITGACVDLYDDTSMWE